MKQYVKLIRAGMALYCVCQGWPDTGSAQEPIEDLRVPVAYYPDGTLKTELFAMRAEVLSDGSILASGIVYRVFTTQATVEMTITAETAITNHEKQTASSDSGVSMTRGTVQVTGTGFDWSGADETLRIRGDARVSFPSEMIRAEGVLNREAE